MPGRIILVVDDSEDDTELIRRAFTACKIVNPMVAFRSGEQALSYLKGTKAAGSDVHSQPVLVLLDIKLPRLHAPDMLRTEICQSVLRQCPFVMLSGIVDKGVENECYKLGASAFLVKPLTAVEVMELALKNPRLSLRIVGDGYFELESK